MDPTVRIRVDEIIQLEGARFLVELLAAAALIAHIVRHW